jgi:hypothetical protein
LDEDSDEGWSEHSSDEDESAQLPRLPGVAIGSRREDVSLPTMSNADDRNGEKTIMRS